MNSGVDLRARAAVSELRRALPDLGPDSDTEFRRSRRRWPAAAVAVLLVGAVAAGLLLGRGDGGTESVVAGPGGELPHLIATDLPPGLEFSTIGQPGTADDEEIRTLVYGRGTGEDPFADGDLGVIVVNSVRDAPLPGVEPVQVRGVTGELGEDESGLRTLVWLEPGLGFVSVGSRTLDDDDLLSVAEGLVRTGEGMAVERPPPGFELLADLDRFPLPDPGSGRIAGPDDAPVVYYQGSARSPLQSMELSVEDAGPAATAAARWAAGSEGRTVTVRGNEGWFTTGLAGVSRSSVVWAEGTGFSVAVVGRGLSEEELLRAAESVRVASEEEWARLMEKGTG